MKKYGVFFLAIILMFSVNAFAGKEKVWILGKVIGNAQNQVVTVKLMGKHDEHEYANTSTNKFGWFAFSNFDLGNPSNYRLVLYVGEQRVKDVGLQGVASGGRVPDIHVP